MVDMMLAYRKLVMNIYHLLVLLTPIIVVAILGFLVGCGSAGFLLTINEIVGNLEAMNKQT